MIYVDIVSDTICPWCYIGKRRFERALDLSGRNDIAISWRPFQLNPDMPSEGMTRDDYVRAKFGGGDRPRQIYQAIAESGREAGIDFQFSRIKRTPNTVLSHRLVHWSAGSERQARAMTTAIREVATPGNTMALVRAKCRPISPPNEGMAISITSVHIRKRA